MERGS
ncbi:hypothetical protein QN277_007892 [Acacia crassicarpa]